MNLHRIRRSLVLLIDPSIIPELERLHKSVEYHRSTVSGLTLKMNSAVRLLDLSVREADYGR